jgi:MSHA biogenesis protein MshP
MRTGRLDSSSSLRQRGFSLAAAIFILVILAGLSAGIIALSTSQHLTQAQDIQGTLAYQAARSAAEYSVYQVAQGGVACTSGSCALAAPPTLDAPLDLFTTQLACSCYGPYDEAGESRTVYRVTATAATGTIGSIGRVERQITATLTR